MIRSYWFCWLFIILAESGFAQTPKTYTILIYHKLAPGKTIQDALPVEREWKAINQAAVDEGNLIGWHMMVKQMTSNLNPAEYDYVTCIVSATPNINGASPGAMTKIYGDSVQTRMASLQKRDQQTAPVVKFEIWENQTAFFIPDFTPGKPSTIVVDFLRLRPTLDPALTDWAATVNALKRKGSAQVRSNLLSGWTFSALLVPAGSEKNYAFAIARPVEKLGVLADPNVSVWPDPLGRSFEVFRQEVFRFEQFTIPKKIN